jgi:hypothetical protein
MKLEMDLVREILLWCEYNLPNDERSFETVHIDIPGYTSTQVAFHFLLLIDAGYIDAEDARDLDNRFDYMPNHLTLRGYEFLEAIKSDTVWNGMKEEAGKNGIQAIKLALPTLAEIVRRQWLGTT